MEPGTSMELESGELATLHAQLRTMLLKLVSREDKAIAGAVKKSWWKNQQSMAPSECDELSDLHFSGSLYD